MTMSSNFFCVQCGNHADQTTCRCGKPLEAADHNPQSGGTHNFVANGCECYLPFNGQAVIERLRQRVSSMVPLTEHLAAFHVKFGLEYTGLPRLLPGDLQDFRERFLGEEVTEYIEGRRVADDGIRTNNPAMVRDGLAQMLDGLVDLVYVALGTAYLHGFDFDEAWRRVHGANMEKVRATSPLQSKRGSTFDVVKPQDWVAPDLSDLVTPNAHEGDND